MNELFGFKFEKLAKTANEVFNLIESGDECFYITRKTYRHEEEGLVFDYKYALKSLPTEVYSDDCPEGTKDYEIELVPMPHSLCPEIFQSVLDCVGLTESDMDWENEERLIPDMDAYGATIRMSVAMVEGEHEESKVCDIAANAIDCIDALVGFFLDRKWNAVGNDGWDLLYHFIHNKAY